MRRRVTIRGLANFALGCFILLLVSLATLHILRTDCDPLRRRLSEYAVGRFGYLMTAAFALACAGLLALSDALWRAAVRSPWLRLGRVALAAAGALDGLMAVFAADSSAPDPSRLVVVSSTGWIHDRLALAHAFCWCVAIVAVPPGLHGDARWRGLARKSALAGAGIGAAIGVRILAPPELIGLTQRLWIGAVMVWCVLHAVEIRKAATSG
jgi:hypothetical protein